ncbi:ATP-grasp domain-containing protein [Bacillus cereus]|uniref:ATP-grasp domain-containing protein n=1 Tax=Bacillus cereus TaxID=1396 RepID=UPI000BFB5F44|nr:ATP-grasp domain-containing protein [Bacillus cereus]PGW29663.1 hypothetical protein COD88_05210 [Bacillus cereus]
MKVLMVGYNSTLLQSISDNDYNCNITVIEEEELYQKKRLYERKFKCLNDVIFCEYQQTRKYLDLIDLLKEEDFDAIVAGLEYAVVATNDIAKELNLPFAGENVANFLTNKLMLRNFCHSNGISQPNYRQVKDLADIQDFFRGAPIVLKPANRQASLGVIKISNKEEIFQAWNEVINIDETNQIPNREMKWEYLVEDCMVGIEISSEVFVKNKQLLFINNTEKKITSGRYSVEIAHLVPARISVETSKLLFDYIKKIVDCLGFENGILHFEIMITNDGPKIIEVAGRPPGDMIFKLIEHSYGFKPYEEYIKVLSRKNVRSVFPIDPYRGSCIYFLNSSCSGVWSGNFSEDILKSSSVINWGIYIKPGDVIREIKSSWDRIGHVMTVSSTSNDAYKKARELNEMILNQEGENHYV